MTRTLLKISLRDLLRRPLQVGLMIVGIALGVAVVIAIDLANTSARRAFQLSTETVVGRTTHHVLGGPSGVPADVYRQLRVEWGFRNSAPVVEGSVIAVDLDEQPLRLLGIDPPSEAPFRGYISQDSLAAAGLSRFYVEPNSAMIGAGLAERYGLSLEDTLRIQVADRFETVTIVGLLVSEEDGRRRSLDGLLLADVATAQELLSLASSGTLTRIDLVLTPAEAGRLAGLLPDGLRVAAASEQVETVAQLTSAFQLNLTALSLLALVVGMFLIYNTVMFSVVQRRKVLGILRSVGVTGEQLFGLILLETAAVAAIGSILGLGLGWVLGQAAVGLVTQTINDLYYVLSVREAPLTALAMGKGLGLGIGAGVLAAVAPAFEAASVEPVTVMRRSALEDSLRARLPLLTASGIALGGLGVIVLLAAGQSLVASFGGLLAIVLGLALIVPVATIGLMRAIGPLARRALGPLGGMAAGTVVRSMSRTSVAIAALMVAVSVTIGVSVMIASFRATVVNWLDLTLVADVYISAPAAGGTRTAVSLSPDIPNRVAAVPGIAEVEAIRNVVVGSEFGEVQLAAADTQRRRSAELYRFGGRSPEDIWRLMSDGWVIISEPFAYRHQLPARGAHVLLHTDYGERSFPVAAIYYDYSSDQGTILMARHVYQQHWNDRSISALAVYVVPGADIQAVAHAAQSALAGTALQVQDNRSLREQAIVVFDRTFAITNALRLLAVIVAFIGVLSALMALQIERARDLATLQALGVTPGQLWRLSITETSLMGATAGLLSLPTGFVLALVLIYVINLRSFGWTIQLTLEPWVFVQALLVSVAAAVLASVYPMFRLLRQPIAAALRQE
jgi:putative ABC transport system permease protein